MSAQKFRWSQPKYEAVVPAKQFGPWLTRLPDQNPATIVEAAADRKSPAHRLFQWDESLAAQEYRLLQARIILGSFVIETEVTTKGRGVKWIDVPYISRSAPGQYEVTHKAMKTPDKRDFILKEALREFKRLRTRYANLSDLAVVFAAMDEVETRVSRRRA